VVKEKFENNGKQDKSKNIAEINRENPQDSLNVKLFKEIAETVCFLLVLQKDFGNQKCGSHKEAVQGKIGKCARHFDIRKMQMQNENGKSQQAPRTIKLFEITY